MFVLLSLVFFKDLVSINETMFIILRVVIRDLLFFFCQKAELSLAVQHFLETHHTIRQREHAGVVFLGGHSDGVIEGISDLLIVVIRMVVYVNEVSEIRARLG